MRAPQGGGCPALGKVLCQGGVVPMVDGCVEPVVMGSVAAQNGGGRGVRRVFSARPREAAFLQARGHSRKETAEMMGVAPETVSVWKRHPQWQVEVERWRELADQPLDAKELRLKLDSLEATREAIEQ